jgi:hypothetical protein
MVEPSSVMSCTLSAAAIGFIQVSFAGCSSLVSTEVIRVSMGLMAHTFLVLVYRERSV